MERAESSEIMRDSYLVLSSISKRDTTRLIIMNSQA